jgi:hypothetical protein
LAQDSGGQRGVAAVEVRKSQVDPTQPVDFSESRRSSVLKLTFDANGWPTAKRLAYSFREMVLALRRHF